MPEKLIPFHSPSETIEASWPSPEGEQATPCAEAQPAITGISTSFPVEAAYQDPGAILETEHD